MSLSQDHKKTIIEHHYKSSCCRRALLFGAMFAKGRAEDKTVTISVEKSEYAEFLSRIIKEFYNRVPSIYHPKSGGRCLVLEFESDSAAKYVANITNKEDLFIQKCGGCLSAFLRGVFLACGRAASPEKQYSLEFTLCDRCEIFADFLRELSLSPLLARRKAGDMVYFRNSADIEDFYGYVGFNQAVFDLIERKINTLAKRETQRFMNCVSNNQNRMLDYAERQISLIKKLDDLNLLSSLPDELEQTARLRMEYFELPLSALALKHNPPISKSGLSHRLRNLEEMGNKLLEDSNGNN